MASALASWVASSGRYLELQFVYIMLLDQVPFHHFEELVEILFDLFQRELTLVDREKPAFEEGVGQCEVRLVEQHPADVERKEEIGFAAQVAADLGVDVLCELICVLHVAFREGHLEKLVVQFRLGEAADFGDRQREFRIDSLQFVLFDLQDRGALCRGGIEFVYVHLHRVADFLTEERFACRIAHADQPYIGLFDLHFRTGRG
ncbi:MAG: hypothetical protein ACLR8Y_01110 [Alistipes indistinctus]